MRFLLPTVDILLEITDDCETGTVKKAIASAGWTCMFEQKEPQLKLIFNKGYTPQGFADQVYHLHLRRSGNWNELYFRDYLSLHSDTAREYEALKLRLKEKYKHNRDAYTEHKSGFIQKYTKIARKEFENRYSDAMIIPASLKDLSLVREITQNAISEIYPKYYPAGISGTRIWQPVD